MVQRATTLSPFSSLRRVLWLSFLISGLFFWPSAKPVSALPAGFQEFYLPLPAEATRGIFVAIDNDPVPSNDFRYVVGVTASADNTTVYYDHWENGYTNGASGDEVITLNKGQVHTFESNVPSNPRGSSTVYDGRDRIYVAGSLLQLVVATWPVSPGTVYAESWEVYPRQAWETTYVVPVGTSLSSVSTDFTRVQMQIMSASDGNNITIVDPVASTTTPITLNRGQVDTRIVTNVGTRITASAPVQVQLFTGRPNAGSNSEIRGYTLTPRSYWSNQYVAPVPSWSNARSNLFLYNPNSTALTITYTDRTGSGTFSIPAGTTRSYFQGAGRYVPVGSGVLLQGNNVFWGIASADTGSPTWDWGYDLIPTNFLTTDNYVSWAKGSGETVPTVNGSPVFVTALNDNTTVFVDYGPNNNVFDATYTLNRLQSIQIFDPDKDNTGMRLVSTDVIAVAWGESPDVAGAGTPYLDMGYTTLPLPQEWIDIALTVDKTASPTAVEIGQEVTFSINTSVPTGSPNATGVRVVDQLPRGWEYVAGSSNSGAPVITGSVATGSILTFNLNWTVQPGTPRLLQFRARPTQSVDTTVPNRNVAIATGLVVSATLTADDDAFVNLITYPVVAATKRASLLTDADNNGIPSPGDTLQYVVQVTNRGTAAAQGVVLTDVVDPNTAVVCSPAPVVSQGSVGACSATQLTANLGTIAVNGSATVTFRARIKSPVAVGVQSVSNQGTISGTNFSSVLTDDPDLPGTKDPTVTLITAKPALSASKSARLVADVDGNGEVSPGDLLFYRVTLVNTGSTDATGVIFRDSTDPLTVLLTGSVTTTVGTVNLGNGVTDSAVEINVGTVPATGVPISITFQVSITNPLPAGVLRVRNQGIITANNAPSLVTDDPSVLGNDNPTITLVTSAPRLTASKSATLLIDADNNGVPSPGDTLLYQITVRNLGNSAAVNVRYADVPDPNASLVVGSVQASPGTIVQGNNSGDQSVKIDLPTLGGGGQSAQISYRAVIAKPLPAGISSVSNQGSVSADNSAAVLTDDPNVSGPNDATVVQVTASPRLVATKRAVLDVDADGNGLFSPGDTVLYIVTVANLGNRAASTVVYSDTVDVNTVLLNGSVMASLGAVQQGNGAGDSRIRIDFGTLAGGAQSDISYRVQINDPLPAGINTIRNQGRVTSREIPLVLTDDPTLTGAADATVLGVTAVPLLTAFKTETLFNDNDNDGVLSPGDTLLYQVLVTNIGNGEATNLVYTDTPDPNTTLVNGSVDSNRGIVVSGNGGEASIRVEIPALPGRSRPLRISYLVTVNNPLLPGVTVLRNQGLLTSDQLPPLVTDDPNTVAINDVTSAPLALGGLTGTIFNDVDGSGVHGLFEPELAGIAVTIRDSSNNIITTVLSGPNGTYLVQGLTPGAYTVNVAALPNFFATTPTLVPVNVPTIGNVVVDVGFQEQGTVSGVVFDDTDGNGVYNVTESPLPNVTIRLLQNNVAIATTTTDSTGYFLFTGVISGSYTVEQTDLAGFVSTTPNLVPVSVGPGGAASVRFGDQQVGSISGVVFADFNGNGLREPSEQPLANVTITLRNGGGSVVATTVTDDNGFYQFTSLTPGNYQVVESDPSGYVSTTPNVVPVVVVENGAATVNFGDQQTGTVSGVVYSDFNGNGIQDPDEIGIPGVTITLDLGGGNTRTMVSGPNGGYVFEGITPGSYGIIIEQDPTGYVSTTPNRIVVTLVSGGAATANFGDQQVGTISGKVFDDHDGDGVIDANENGIAAVTVTLLNAQGNVIATTTTAGNGNYLFTNVAPGNYTVVETDPVGYASTTLNQVGVYVAPGGAGVANFGDRPVGSVSGIQFNDLNGDGIQNAGELGIGGVTISLVDAGGTTIATTTTSSNGAYLFTNVPTGVYTVVAGAISGYVDTTPNVVAVVLLTNSAVTANFGDQQTGTISGVVYNDINANGVADGNESGLGGVTIQLRSSNGNVIATTTTSGDGRYLFAGVNAGSYVVEEVDPVGFLSTTNNRVTLTLPAGGAGSANFGDQQQGAVSGVVFNDFNGNGIQDPDEPGLGGVVITLDLGGGVIVTTTTTLSGIYTFGNLPPGSYAVIIEQDPTGFVSTTPNRVPVNIPPGGSANANFGDRQVGTIAGEVYVDINANGIPESGEATLGGVTITLRNSQGVVIATTTTTVNGTYLFTNVPPGSYIVEETDPIGFTSTTLNQVAVILPAGGAAVANFGDLPIGIVTGIEFNDVNGNGVQDFGEPGIGGVTIELVNSSGAVVRTTTTSGNGAYQFLNVTAGAYVVRASDPAGFVSTTPNIVPVSVTSNGVATANFGDQQVGAISGVAFNDLNGNGIQDFGEPGLSGVAVQLTTANGTVLSSTVTNGTGGYLFPGLTAGNYRVIETTPNGFVSTTPDNVPVVLPPGGAGSANFGDRQLGVISGVVFYDINSDGRQGNGESGLAGVVIQLLNAAGTVIAQTETNVSGHYLFTDLSAGNYTVREQQPTGFVDTTPNSVNVTLPAGGSGTANFGEKMVATVSGVVFYDSNANGVQEPHEAGLSGVTVELRNAGGAVVATTVTAANGSYLFTQVDPGSYAVVEIDAVNHVSTTPNSVAILVPAGGSATANFGDRQIGLIEGIVFLDADRDTVLRPGERGFGGVQVELLDGNGTVIATTVSSSQGTYHFANIAPGNYRVRIVVPTDYMETTPPTVAVVVPPNGIGTANFGIIDEGPVLVGGRVWFDNDGNGIQGDPQSEPGVPNIVVTLYRTDTGQPYLVNGQPLTTTTGIDGSYIFGNLPPGDYYVVFAPDTAPQGYSPTLRDQGEDDALDSDTDETGRSSVTGALGAGSSNLTLSMGLSPIDLSLGKAAGVSQVRPGELLNYSLTYTNNGNLVIGAYIEERVPAHSVFVADGSTSGWSCQNGATAGTICRLEVGALAPGASGSVAFVVRVNTPLPSEVGTIVNLATIGNPRGELEPNLPNNTGTDTTEVLDPTAEEPGQQPSPGIQIFLPHVGQNPSLAE